MKRVPCHCKYLQLFILAPFVGGTDVIHREGSCSETRTACDLQLALSEIVWSTAGYVVCPSGLLSVFGQCGGDGIFQLVSYAL